MFDEREIFVFGRLHRKISGKKIISIELAERSKRERANLAKEGLFAFVSNVLFKPRYIGEFGKEKNHTQQALGNQLQTESP